MNHIKYSKETLETAVKKSYSIMAVLRELGMKMSGGTHGHISNKIKMFNIDTSHFNRQGINKGKSPTNKKSWQEILIKTNSPYKEDTLRLRRALMESGREYKCEECGIKNTWNNKPICIQIDHINGYWNDNTPTNLRFLCPNCHSQTSTFGVQKTKFTVNKLKICKKCNNEFIYNTYNRKYCSVLCANNCKKIRKFKIEWPEINYLLNMVKKTNYVSVAKQLGVSDVSVKKHIQRYATVVERQTQ